LDLTFSQSNESRAKSLFTHPVGVNTTITDWQSRGENPDLPGFRVQIDPGARFAHAIVESTRHSLTTSLKTNAIECAPPSPFPSHVVLIRSTPPDSRPDL
jgi:hypothetical protein